MTVDPLTVDIPLVGVVVTLSVVRSSRVSIVSSVYVAVGDDSVCVAARRMEKKSYGRNE